MQESHTFLAKLIHWTFIPLYAYGIFKQVDDIEALEDQALLIFETIFAATAPADFGGCFSVFRRAVVRGGEYKKMKSRGR